MSWGGGDSLPGTASLAHELDRPGPHRVGVEAGRVECQKPLHGRGGRGHAGFLDGPEKLLVILRDGRKIVGILRSFDQFANVVLEGAVERIIVGEQYCDLPLGLYIIRGENLVLIGALDPTAQELPPNMVQVSASAIRKAQKEEKEASELKDTMRKRMEFLDLE
eukprot:jgi/Mesen1/3444/ME000194S02589